MRRSFLLLAAAALIGCSPSAPAIQPAPEFALLDVNPNSATLDMVVSPRDHMGSVSGWYFGSAT